MVGQNRTERGEGVCKDGEAGENLDQGRWVRLGSGVNVGDSAKQADR